MNKAVIGLLIAVVVAGNIVTVALLLGERGSSVPNPSTPTAATAPSLDGLVEAVNALRVEVERISAEQTRPGVVLEGEAGPATSNPAGTPADVSDGALSSQLGQLLQRIEAMEKNLAAIKEVNDEVAFAKLRQMRQEQFRAEDGQTVADELLAQKKYAVGANGILTFLDAHPDHPDARDLMAKARQAFLQAGYQDKAIWLQEQMMEKFPENRGSDLYSLAMMKKKAKRIDEALGHISESIDIATTEQDRMNRMFYRAYLVHQRDGDEAGLSAYNDVARSARAAGIENPGKAAENRANEIQERLAKR